MPSTPRRAAPRVVFGVTVSCAGRTPWFWGGPEGALLEQRRPTALPWTCPRRSGSATDPAYRPPPRFRASPERCPSQGPPQHPPLSVGRVAYGEAGLRGITSFLEGWIEQFFVNTT